LWCDTDVLQSRSRKVRVEVFMAVTMKIIFILDALSHPLPPLTFRDYSCAPICADSVSSVSVILGSPLPPQNWKIKEINSL
jgi:hypothetical protein